MRRARLTQRGSVQRLLLATDGTANKTSRGLQGVTRSADLSNAYAETAIDVALARDAEAFNRTGNAYYQQQLLATIKDAFVKLAYVKEHGTSADRAAIAVERLCKCVAASLRGVSISAGISCSYDYVSGAVLRDRADAALYEASARVRTASSSARRMSGQQRYMAVVRRAPGCPLPRWLPGLPFLRC